MFLGLRLMVGISRQQFEKKFQVTTEQCLWRGTSKIKRENS